MKNPAASWFLIALSALNGCAEKRRNTDAGMDANVPSCGKPTTGTAAPFSQPASSVAHVIDGRFTGQEWANAIRLEGLFTDVYLDYRAPYLYMLNDWRANAQGIRPDCYNQFDLNVGGDRVDVKVYGDDHVDVTGATEVAGAYSLSPSPLWTTPHTIWEFKLAVKSDQIDICCYDPVTSASCDQLSQEPSIFSIQTNGGGGLLVTRTTPASTSVLANGSACGGGQGICGSGSTCLTSDAGTVCTAGSEVDAGGPVQ
jgi:hypothetical protein